VFFLAPLRLGVQIQITLRRPDGLHDRARAVRRACSLWFLYQPGGQSLFGGKLL